MSLNFLIKTNKPIRYKALTSELNIDNLEYANHPSDSDENIDSTTTLFIMNQSVRGVFLEYKDQIYTIKIRAIASEDDFKLAIRTAKGIARVSGELISPEGDQIQYGPDEIDNTYNADWINSKKTFGIAQIMNRLEKQKGTYAFWVCYMNFFVGQKIHKQLDKSSVENYYHSLGDYLRSKQFFDRSEYIIPKVQAFQHPNTDEIKEVVTFYPHGNQFLSFANTVMFINQKNNTYSEVPYSVMRKIRHDKIKRIDDVQYVVDKLSEEDYDKILNTIKKVANYLNRKNAAQTDTRSSKNTASNRPKNVKNIRSKWWQFWKKS